MALPTNPDLIGINLAPPLKMHIDLNSCFATVEQQVNPHLRGRPVAIAAYITPGGCILSPSIEAKKLGIKTGMRVREAREIFPHIVVRDPDPMLVRDIHSRFRKICLDYSPSVIPKSIDEVIIDFTGLNGYLKKSLIEIGTEIKKRFRREIGDWISCSIGIGTNRFLAKTGSSLHKPDGLDVINHKNLKDIYSRLTLVDLNGINIGYEARLNRVGIFTPLDFLAAADVLLRKQVFGGIVGHYWYLRLRGYEVDDYSNRRRSFGQDYALPQRTNNKEELKKIIMKLCEKMGRRLRKSGQVAYGIHIALLYEGWSNWHKGKKFTHPLYTTQELYQKAVFVFSQSPSKNKVAKIAVSCYELKEVASVPQTLFQTDADKKRKLSDAVDAINDLYGEYVITPALMMNMDKTIIDRIAFSSI